MSKAAAASKTSCLDRQVMVEVGVLRAETYVLREGAERNMAASGSRSTRRCRQLATIPAKRIVLLNYGGPSACPPQPEITTRSSAKLRWGMNVSASR